MVRRLRRSDCSAPGIARRRAGKGWTYWHPDGTRITDPVVLERIDSLVIPPAWQDVWICVWGHGHIQATGVDARERRQYRYHDRWRQKQDQVKFDRVLQMAARLPAAREQVQADLASRGLTQRRVSAAAVRLLDLGFFRVGGEQYAAENNTYGLATLRREHASVSRDGVITFDYTAKSGKHRVQRVADPAVCSVVRGLLRRRDPSDELLAWKRRDGSWCDVTSADINAAVQGLLGEHTSAKDFRTWSATVLAAVGLAVATGATSPTARKRAVSHVVKEVAGYLGNTPAVCRASYIDPRIVDLYENGTTITDRLDELGSDALSGSLATQGAIEAAVLELLSAHGGVDIDGGQPDGDNRGTHSPAHAAGDTHAGRRAG